MASVPCSSLLTRRSLPPERLGPFDHSLGRLRGGEFALPVGTWGLSPRLDPTAEIPQSPPGPFLALRRRGPHLQQAPNRVLAPVRRRFSCGQVDAVSGYPSRGPVRTEDRCDRKDWLGRARAGDEPAAPRRPAR